MEQLYPVICLSGRRAPGGGESESYFAQQQLGLGSDDEPTPVTSGPEEAVFKGRRFVRHDLVSEAQWQMMRDPQNLEPQGAPDPLSTPTDDTQPARDPEAIRKLAIQLMAHVQNGADYYVEAEPPLALAERILYPSPDEALIDRPAMAPPVVEKGGIIGSDNGFPTSCPWCSPDVHIGFLEAQGSGTLIGVSTLYTAAHVHYSNADSPGGVGWRCRNGAPDTNTALPFTNPCNGPGDSGDPRWFFAYGRLNCNWSVTVPNGWASMASGTNEWTRAREDYAVAEFDCDAGLGYIGLTLLSAGPTELHLGWHGGYPLLYPCPPNAVGASFLNSNDCPTGTVQHSSFNPPIFSANLYWTDLEPFVPGDQQSSRTWRGYMDVSSGSSGGPLTDSVGRIIGVASNVNPAGVASVNRFNRLESTVYNFILAHSSL